jgi:hypothetical protein
MNDGANSGWSEATVQMMVIILGTINKVDRAAGAGVTARAEKMLRDSATSRMQLSASSQPMLASTSQHSCVQYSTYICRHAHPRPEKVGNCGEEA